MSSVSAASAASSAASVGPAVFAKRRGSGRPRSRPQPIALYALIAARSALTDDEAFAYRSDIEAQYVAALREWSLRAPAEVQVMTGAVEPLMVAHSQLQDTYVQGAEQFERERAARNGTPPAVEGRRATVRFDLASPDESKEAAHREAKRWRRAEAERRSARKKSAKRPFGDVDSPVATQPPAPPPPPTASPAAAASPSAPTPPAPVAAPPPAPSSAGSRAKRMRDTPRQGVRSGAHEGPSDAADAAMDGHQPPVEPPTVERPTTAESGSPDGQVVPATDAAVDGSQSSAFSARPKRRATQRREILLAPFQVPPFSLRLFSIAAPPALPSFPASDVSLYSQAQQMLRAQFPKIGRVDQPSTSYYATLSIEPFSPYHGRCLDLFPQNQRPYLGPSIPLVVAASLFDLTESLYFRLLFFASPVPSYGFASLLLSHLRCLAARLELRLVVCATLGQKEFWTSVGFYDAAQSAPPGLSFGDTILMAKDSRGEAVEVEERRKRGVDCLLRVRDRMKARLDGRQQQRSATRRVRYGSHSAHSGAASSGHVAAAHGHRASERSEKASRRAAATGSPQPSAPAQDAARAGRRSAAVGRCAAPMAGPPLSARGSSPAWAFPSLTSSAVPTAPSSSTALSSSSSDALDPFIVRSSRTTPLSTHSTPRLHR